MLEEFKKNYSLNGAKYGGYGVFWVANRMMTREEFRVWVDTWCQGDYSHGHPVRGGLCFKTLDAAEGFLKAITPHGQHDAGTPHEPNQGT